MQIYIPPGPRLGDVVVDTSNLKKAYGDKLLIDNLSFSIPRGAIVGLIGPNGSGKSTLFRMITGNENPDSGEIKVGSTVKMSYVDQSRVHLDPEKTVWETISENSEVVTLGHREVASRAYVSWFNFSGGDQQKKISDLSALKQNNNLFATSIFSLLQCFFKRAILVNKLFNCFLKRL